VYVDVAASPEGQRTAVAVQSALLGAGSLQERVLASLARRPVLARRYLAVEAHRALWVQRNTLPVRFRRLIDVGIATRSDSPATSLQIARGRTAIVDPPAAFGLIQPGRMVAPTGTPAARGTGAPHQPRSNPAELHEFSDDVDDDDVTFDVLSSPVGGGGGLGQLLKRLLGDARSSGSGEPGADAPTRWSRVARPSSASGRVSPTSAAVVDGEGVAAFGNGAATYPEWDSGRRRYKPDWCTVLQTDTSASGIAPLSVPDSEQLRRALTRIGLEFERCRRQPQGDDIDVDAAVEARVDVRAGCLAHDAVYVDALRRRRDLSALILLDISGSAGEPGVNGVPVHQMQRTVAATLTRVLFGLGDRVALYGFRSHGRSAVHVVRLKRFDEVFGDVVLRRLGALTPGAYTRLGAAIRHGTAVLEREAGTARRLLIVISDGFAYDHGYERAYGEGDARRALTEARNLGIGCVCLSVGARMDASALRRVFGTAAHAAIDDPRELPPVIGRLFTYALGTAARQRLTSRRRLRSAERLRIERTAS
jgi:Mg-chelatase subunit ChlD